MTVLLPFLPFLTSTYLPTRDATGNGGQGSDLYFKGAGWATSSLFKKSGFGMAATGGIARVGNAFGMEAIPGRAGVTQGMLPKVSG